MYELFDDKKSYMFPNGRTMTKDDISESGQYSLFGLTPIVVNLSDRIIRSYIPLAQFAEDNGVDYDSEDPEKTLSMVIEKQK